MRTSYRGRHDLWQSSLENDGDPMSASMVRSIVIIHRRYGAIG